MAINRRQTFLVKWAVAVAAAPALTGIVLLVAVGILGMYAPNVLLLWGLLALAALMIATGTLALLAIFGSIGQLLAMILLIYLSIASAGGTVPPQALPGVLKIVGHVEPLRNTLMGTRAILYSGARGDAGLTTSLIVLAAAIVFWGALGLAAAYWYDHRRLDRISPELIDYINRTVERPSRKADTPELGCVRRTNPSRRRATVARTLALKSHIRQPNRQSSRCRIDWLCVTHTGDRLCDSLSTTRSSSARAPRFARD